jgi:hypothetical protein
MIFFEEYDIIIIGAGMSGLYSAYNILKYNPQKKIIILEKNSKKYIGGRAGNYNFYGTSVVIGAGIGRFKKDKLLKKLLIELNFPIVTYQTSHDYSTLISPICNVKDIYMKIKNEFLKNPPPHQTFKKYAHSIIDNQTYSNFVTCVGLSDFENEDIYDTIYHYGMKDNYEDFKMFSVPWSSLVEKLVKKVGLKNIKNNSEVIKIIKMDGINKTDKNDQNNYTISIKNTKTNDIYSLITKKIIIATNINSVLSLLSMESKACKTLYENIHGQPFMRMYAKFSKSMTEILSTYVHTTTIVSGPLQKVIPINIEKGVFMIAYSDNKNALYLEKIVRNQENLKNNKEVCKKLCRIIEESLGIPKNTLKMIAYKAFFWNIGTHYYGVLDTKKYINREEYLENAQKPSKNMRIVGEMISIDQGWTNGALDSVEKVITKKWVNS